MFQMQLVQLNLDCFQKFTQFTSVVGLDDMVHQSSGMPEGRREVVFTGLDPEGNRRVGLPGPHVTVQNQVLQGDNRKIQIEELQVNGFPSGRRNSLKTSPPLLPELARFEVNNGIKKQKLHIIQIIA